MASLLRAVSYRANFFPNFPLFFFLQEKQEKQEKQVAFPKFGKFNRGQNILKASHFQYLEIKFEKIWKYIKKKCAEKKMLEM